MPAIDAPGFPGAGPGREDGAGVFGEGREVAAGEEAEEEEKEG